MKAVQLPHFSVCAPCRVTGAGVAQVSVRELVEPACAVKGRRALISKRFAVGEAICTRRIDGFFVQAHRVKITPFDPGYFRGHKRSAVFEIIRAILGPDLELSAMCSQTLQMLRPIVDAYVVAGCSTRKRAVKVIFGLFNETGRYPK